MSKFRKIDTISIIRGTGIVPVFYNADVELTKKVVKACYDGGIRAFEFTNRGDGAHRVFKEVISFVRGNKPCAPDTCNYKKFTFSRGPSGGHTRQRPERP